MQYRGFHPEVAKEIAATIVPGLIDKLCEGDPEMATTLRSRHERVAQRAAALAPKLSVTVKGCKYLGGIGALPRSGAPVNIAFNPCDIQIKILGASRLYPL